MTLNKRLILRALTFVLALGGAGLVASPAFAVPCPAGKPCFWDNANRGGNWVYSNFSGNVGSPYNDKASSFQNNTNRNVVWYWNTNCTGNVAMVLSAGQWQNASWFNNDETTSVC